MKKSAFLTLAACGLLLIASQPASANWVHFSDSIFDALGQRVEHPSRLERIITLPTDAEGALVEGCIGYVNSRSLG